jgi:hypothetical protein
MFWNLYVVRQEQEMPKFGEHFVNIIGLQFRYEYRVVFGCLFRVSLVLLF